LDIWRYPLHWFDGSSPTPILASPSSEAGFVDVRWIFVIVGATAFLAALIVPSRWRTERLREPATGFIFAFVIAYLIWLFRE
jgi:hypothetical protein